jgi:hypothetical protein
MAGSPGYNGISSAVIFCARRVASARSTGLWKPSGGEARFTDLVDNAIGAFFAGSVIDHNGGAFGGQTFGDTRADSLGSAGYDSYFTL